MTYTKLQNYANMMVSEHGIQTFKIIIVVVSVITIVVVWYLYPQKVQIPYYFKRNGLFQYT